MRKLPVPRAGSERIGSPRIESQPSRSTSNGFIATATAGYSHDALCWSIAREIASRFLASDEELTTPSLRVHDRLRLGAAQRLDRVVDRLPQPIAQLHPRLPAQEIPRARDVRLAHLRIVDRQRLEHDLG